MKIVKIGAVWCGGCLAMNKVWERIKKDYYFDYIELDYDMDEDEVLRYNPGKVLPVFIFFDDDEKEVLRIVGEVSYHEFVDRMVEGSVISEEEE